MKRYLLFMFGTYYPSGGWNDFVGSFDTLDEAKGAAEPLLGTENNSDTTIDHFHVIDITTASVVHRASASRR